ncbi:transcriptional regulator ArsR family [Clostridium aceticum]|uniref:Transcriptional regulator ArsR family n=1 Tax=Clostridium aceticum TaxID=84022 RepID=A0A0D8IBH8_9CLOT|nr:metalloregulator ArsR/SmtB family transcription factor [Clostridium aceticum]AKL96966.1 transcriptional regulator ArsR family [Clostridium aceticum]KJF27434.1 ArsR family transcriptional regulator [Clostridium aceticum]
MDFELIFKALGEGTRIKIIKILSLKPMYVCELEGILGISQPRISQHLKILKHASLVEVEKEGQRAIYSLNKKLIETVSNEFIKFLDKPLEELEEFDKEYQKMQVVSEDLNIAICKSCSHKNK